MYLGGPTFELGGPIFGRGVLENTPIPLFEQILNSSPMGVFSRDYGTGNESQRERQLDQWQPTANSACVASVPATIRAESAFLPCNNGSCLNA